METGKQRISTAVPGHEAKVEEERAPEVVVRPIVRVEELALAIGPGAALEPEIGRVQAVRERAQAAAVELERGRVVAVPGRDLVVAPLKTKLVTAVHRHDLVPLLTAEASVAAGVETSLAPAAVEAVTAWEAVDSAAVAASMAAEDVGEADVEAAADAEDKQFIRRENK
jgi:hypothetical protein